MANHRLRFWCWVFDLVFVAERLVGRKLSRLRDRTIRGMSDATDWGVIDGKDDAPW